MLFNALSINASGHGDLYFSKSFFSNDPAFTPILIEQLLFFAAWITDFILSFDPMFPGFNLKQSAPDSAASIALL